MKKMTDEEQLLKMLNEKDFKILSYKVSVEEGLSIQQIELIVFDEESE